MSSVGIAFLTHKNKYLLEKDELQNWSFLSVSFNSIGTDFRFPKFVKEITKKTGISKEELLFDYINDLLVEKEINQPYSFLYKVRHKDKEKEKIIEGDAISQGKLKWFSLDEILNLKNPSPFIEKKINEITPYLKNESYFSGFNYDTKTFNKSHKNYSSELNEIDSSLPFDDNFLASIQRLRTAKEQNKLVVFAGAGISANSDVPMWWSLIQDLKDDMTLEYNEDDYLAIAQLYYNERLENEYQKKIRDSLKFNKTVYNPIHISILGLSPVHILTTNYDNLFEQAISDLGLPYSFVKKDNDLPYAKSSKLLVKMHGDFDEKNLVLKEDDYLDYEKNFPLTEAFVRGIFASNVVLFLGFSFSDINLKYIIQRVRNILKNDFQPAYIFFTGEISRQRREYLKKKGLIALSYNSQIENYLKKINRHKLVFQEKEKSRGQKTYNFIEFVNHFDFFTEKTKSKHIVDQMYLSLKRFDELVSIPPNRLVKLFPFAPIKSNHFQVNVAKFSSGYHLETRNEKILRFLSKISIKDGKLIIPSKEQELTKRRTKIEYIFKKLNLTPVFCIQRKDDPSKKNHNRIFLTERNDCRCERCLFDEFEFDTLLEKIDNGITINLCVDEFTNTNLVAPYLYFKIGKYTESYFLLRKLRTKSWREGKYITYFLCNYNMRILRGVIKSFFRTPHLSIENKTQIIDEIDEIDLDEILQKLPVEKEVKQVLLDIREGKLLNEAEKEARRLHKEIVKVYEMYKNSRSFRMGYSEIQKLLQELVILNTNIKGNLLFDDDFYDFENLVNIVWEGIILSYMTDDSYENKLEDFDFYYIRLAILHADPEKIYRTLSEHKPPLIKIGLDSKKVLKNAMNFFKSNFRKDLFNELKENKLFYRYCETSYTFQRKVKRIGNNFLLILAFANLEDMEDDSMEVLCDTIIKYFYIDLQKDKSINTDYFLLFLKKKIKYFSNTSLEFLIHTITINKFLIDNFFPNVLDIIEEDRGIIQITKPNIKNRILTFVQTDEVPLKYLLTFFPYLNGTEQQSMKSKIDEILIIEEFNSESSKLYHQSLWLNIISEKDSNFFPNYLNYLKSFFPLANNIKFDEEGFPIDANGSWNPLVRFFNLYHKKKYSIKSIEILLKDKAIPPFYSWALNPRKFNYKNFDSNWLIIFGKNDDFIKKLKEREIPKMMVAIEASLKNKYNDKLARIYFEKLKV